MTIQDAVNKLTPRQLRDLHALHSLNFRTYGDRRRTETLRDGLTRYLENLESYGAGKGLARLEEALRAEGWTR